MKPTRSSSNTTLTARRNYWKSKTEETKYTRDIRAMLHEYAKQLQEAAALCTSTDAQGNTVIDTELFIRMRDEITQTYLKAKQEDLAAAHARTGLTLGIRYAAQSMGGTDDGH